jgi:predicted ATPase/class 3 adenylate cyclase
MTLNLPTGIVTFLFTDIEGSTQLWDQHPEEMKVALARHDTILRQTIETNNGSIFKTVGDEFCAAFRSAPDALGAALAVQRALHAEEWGKTPIRVRMALHTGTAETRDGDYFGPPLNRVARLLAAGHGGQTLLSAVTDELVRAHLPPGAELRDMGEWRLKDLTSLEHIYQLLVPDLPAKFPPLKALEAFRTNLPVQLTSFVGREKEMAAIKQLITENRLTTLTGPGGTGKTRLSLRVASDLLDSFINGVWFVELAPLADPALVTQTVMTTLGLREENGRPLLDTLTDYLRVKTALLILDNCEHLVDASAQLAQTLLQACPNVRLLVSSREALGIAGESTYRVPSLSTPDAHLPQSAETVIQCEAARLFIDRAKVVLPTFAITNENAPAIAQVCSRLDGIPLALELAAARVTMLSVEQIAARLDDCFRLLTGGSRTALPRQQTLRALIDWSYDLLSEPERALLRRLSVFAGGWTLEAAEIVCQGINDYDVFDLLTQLVNKSLVMFDAEQATARYRMLETIRQYAREKLSQTDEGMHIRDRHLEYFLGLAERAEPELSGPRVAEWLLWLEAELDNIRTALEWSLNRDAQVGLRLAGALMNYWQARNNMHEGIDWLSQLLRQPAASARNAARARALTSLASLYEAQIESLKAEPFAQEGLAIYRELDDRYGIASALFVLGNALCGHDDYVAGRPLVFESLALYRTLGDKSGITEVLNLLGNFADDQDPVRARTYLEESLELARELGDTAGVADRLGNLGRIAYRDGDFSAARAWLTESLTIHRSLGISDVSFVVEALGELGLREGNYEQARTYLEEGLSLARESGRINATYWILSFLGYVALRQADNVRARSLFIEAQKGFKQAGLKIGVVYVSEGLASLALAQGHPAQAAKLFAWADATREIVDNARPPIEQADVDRELATIHTQLDEAAFTAAYSAGRALGMEEAVALALEATELG